MVWGVSSSPAPTLLSFPTISLLRITVGRLRSLSLDNRTCHGRTGLCCPNQWGALLLDLHVFFPKMEVLALVDCWM